MHLFIWRTITPPGHEVYLFHGIEAELNILLNYKFSIDTARARQSKNWPPKTKWLKSSKVGTLSKQTRRSRGGQQANLSSIVEWLMSRAEWIHLALSPSEWRFACWPPPLGRCVSLLNNTSIRQPTYTRSMEKCVFSRSWRNYVIRLRFIKRKHGKNNYQDGYYGDCMETVWRFYGKIGLEIVWHFHGESMVNQITRQPSY